jgi:hypothetical protein
MKAKRKSQRRFVVLLSQSSQEQVLWCQRPKALPEYCCEPMFIDEAAKARKQAVAIGYRDEPKKRKGD